MMLTLVLILALGLFAPLAFAAQISKVKGKGVLIDLKGESAAPGDSFYALEGDKRRDMIKITKIKGDKTIAKGVKGKAAAGMAVEMRPATVAKGSHKSPVTDAGSGGNRAYWGALFGYGMDTM